jgi:hypothetical protein
VFFFFFSNLNFFVQNTTILQSHIKLILPVEERALPQSRPIKIKIKISQSVKINFWNLSRFSQLSRQTFFVSVKIFKIKTFQSRLCLVKTVEIAKGNQGLSRNLDIIETFWVWKWWKVWTDWEISTRKCKNPLTSQSRLRWTVE